HVVTGAGNALALGAVRHGGDGARVPVESPGLLSGQRVPQLQRSIVAARDDSPAIGAVRHVVDAGRVPPEDEVHGWPSTCPQCGRSVGASLTPRASSSPRAACCREAMPGCGYSPPPSTSNDNATTATCSRSVIPSGTPASCRPPVNSRKYARI